MRSDRDSSAGSPAGRSVEFVADEQNWLASCRGGVRSPVDLQSLEGAEHEARPMGEVVSVGETQIRQTIKERVESKLLLQAREPMARTVMFADRERHVPTCVVSTEVHRVRVREHVLVSVCRRVADMNDRLRSG